MTDTAPAPSAPLVSPTLALELRLRQLESLIGPIPSSSTSASASASAAQLSSPVLIRALAAQRNLESSTSTHASLRRFVKDFDSNRRILDAGFRPVRKVDGAAQDSGSARDARLSFTGDEDDASGGADGAKDRHAGEQDHDASILTPAEQIVMILESEAEMRALERILVECEALEKRGVAGSGTLAEHEPLQPRLSEAQKEFADVLAPRREELEDRLLNNLGSYQTQVDRLSRLFIQWDEALADMESRVLRMERQKARDMGAGETEV